MRAALVICSLLLLAACEPIGPLPGRALSGEVVPAPEDWDEVDDAEVVQIEMVGPYSVNIWGVAAGDAYYIAAGQGDETRWVNRIRRSDEVRLRVEEDVYELRAIEVTDQAELQVVGEAYADKYDLEAEEDFPDVIVYRLEPRTAQ